MGYNTLKSVISDMKLYTIAKLIDSRVMDLEAKNNNASAYLLKKIRQNLKSATEEFKKRYEGYKFSDFYLIAVHDSLRRVSGINEFLDDDPVRKRPDEKLLTLLNSKALKEGHLPLLEEYLPKKLESKQDLIEFIKSNDRLTHNVLRVVCSHYAKRSLWRKWLEQASKEQRIRKSSQGWY